MWLLLINACVSKLNDKGFAFQSCKEVKLEVANPPIYQYTDHLSKQAPGVWNEKLVGIEIWRPLGLLTHQIVIYSYTGQHRFDQSQVYLSVPIGTTPDSRGLALCKRCPFRWAWYDDQWCTILHILDSKRSSLDSRIFSSYECKFHRMIIFPTNIRDNPGDKLPAIS